MVLTDRACVTRFSDIASHRQGRVQSLRGCITAGDGSRAINTVSIHNTGNDPVSHPGSDDQQGQVVLATAKIDSLPAIKAPRQHDDTFPKRRRISVGPWWFGLEEVFAATAFWAPRRESSRLLPVSFTALRIRFQEVPSHHTRSRVRSLRKASIDVRAKHRAGPTAT